MTKQNSDVLLAVLIVGIFAGCAAKPTEHPNDTLAAYQEPKNDKTGVTYGLCTMTWANSFVTEVRIELTYDTEENAEAAYDGLIEATVMLQTPIASSLRAKYSPMTFQPTPLRESPMRIWSNPTSRTASGPSLKNNSRNDHAGGLAADSYINA